MNQGGRPRALDSSKKREILAILSMGCKPAVAAEYVGCAPSTIQRTMERDAEFAEAVARARSGGEVGLVRYVRKAAGNERYWRAAAWALERLYPSRYQAAPARGISAEQLAEALKELARTIVEQIPERYRKEVLRAVEAAMRKCGAEGELPGQRAVVLDVQHQAVEETEAGRELVIDGQL
jgi:hypothetical protein